MILAESYRETSGRYRHPEEVEQRGSDWFIRGEDTPVVAQLEKMSKSKLNVENPIDIIEDYGADALRMYEMFMGPLEQVTPWQTKGVQGLYRFLQRVWRLVVDPNTGERNPKLADAPIPDDLNRVLHIAIQESNEGIEALKLNTPISRMMEFVNDAIRLDTLPIAAVEDLLRLLSPYAPHIAEELWQRLGHEGLCSEEAWPTFDESALQSSTVELVVQVQGKLRGTCSVPLDADNDAIVAAAKALENVQRHLEGMQVIKTIVVPGRLVNFVVKPA
jgi:leucyl-tRNA synthetase